MPPEADSFATAADLVHIGTAILQLLDIACVGGVREAGRDGRRGPWRR